VFDSEGLTCDIFLLISLSFLLFRVVHAEAIGSTHDIKGDLKIERNYKSTNFLRINGPEADVCGLEVDSSTGHSLLLHVLQDFQDLLYDLIFCVFLAVYPFDFAHCTAKTRVNGMLELCCTVPEIRCLR